MTDQVDITGLDKAEVLAALYNRSAPMGLGVLQARSGEMTVVVARQCIDGEDDHARNFPNVAKRGRELDFDYLFGRPLKVNLSGDSFDPWLYDRDNGGSGTAARLVAELRQLRAAS